MLLEVVSVLVLAAGITALFWVMVRSASVKIERQYGKIAQRFRIELTKAEPKLFGFMRPEPFVHGKYRGREISISVPAKGLQGTRQVETTLKVAAASRGFSWQMTSTGLLGGFRQRDSGVKARWSSGDRVFDSAIDVRTNDEERLTRVLHEGRRELILDILKGSKGSIYLGEGVLVFAEMGLIADDVARERFEQITDTFCDLAEVLEGK